MIIIIIVFNKNEICLLQPPTTHIIIRFTQANRQRKTHTQKTNSTLRFLLIFCLLSTHILKKLFMNHFLFKQKNRTGCYS